MTMIQKDQTQFQISALKFGGDAESLQLAVSYMASRLNHLPASCCAESTQKICHCSGFRSKW